MGKIVINAVFYIMNDISVYPVNVLLRFYQLVYNDLYFGMASCIFKDVYHLFGAISTDYDKK